jgi:predicted SAM-dependent methyltransferase
MAGVSISQKAARKLVACKPLRSAMRQFADELKAARISRRGRKRLLALARNTDLKVHLGCGQDLRPGWINIDLFLRPRKFAPVPGATFINYDLRRGLPLSPGSCQLIYSSHFFEHLDAEHGINLMADCYRALAPDGIFRFALPDYRADFEAYLRGDDEYFAPVRSAVWRNGAVDISLVDMINYSVYQFGEHKTILDEQKLTAILTRLGFVKAYRSEFQPGIDIDNDLRRRYSFYFEAIK